MNSSLWISCFSRLFFDTWSEAMTLDAAETIYRDGPAICADFKAHLRACFPQKHT